MLRFYKVKMKYVRNLQNVDSSNNILSVSSQRHKNKRLFLGVVIMLDNHKYCIPLSSVEEKDKYSKMSENITLRKIRNENGDVIAVLNINNMMPVREEYIIPFDIEKLEDDTEKRAAYKKHCLEELAWCNKHENEIIRLAKELHRMICSNENFSKRKICPNYKLLEKECDKCKIIP